MKISVIVVTYNEENTLEKTLQSIINQVDFDKYVELIVIDGASTDGTVDIIKKYSKYITKWISEPDKGIYDAMNKGVKIATGDFVQFLNSADLFFDKYVIKNVVKKIGNDRDSIFYGDVWRYDFKTGKIVGKREVYKDTNGELNFAYTMPIGHQGTFIPRELMIKEPFSLEFKIAGDYDCLYRYFKNGVKFKNLNENIAKFDINGISNSQVLLVTVEGLFIVSRYDLTRINKSAYWSVINRLTENKDLGASLKTFENKLTKLKDVSFFKHPIKKYKLYKDLIANV